MITITIDKNDKDKILNLRNSIKEALDKTIKQTLIFMHGYAVKTTPIDTGFLRKSFFDEYRDGTGYFYNTAYYAPFVNFGTKPYTINVKNKKVLSDGTNIFGPSVKHPGIKANPFMERILEEAEKEIPKFLQSNLNEKGL